MSPGTEQENLSEQNRLLICLIIVNTKRYNTYDASFLYEDYNIRV